MKARKFMCSAAALLILSTSVMVQAQEAAPPQATSSDRSAERSPGQERGSFAPAQSATVGQKGEQNLIASPSSATPHRTFTSGTGNTGFRYAVSLHGNVVNLESPIFTDTSGNPLYRHLFGGEGYAVSMNTTIGRVTYWDAGFSEATGCSGTSRSWSSTVVESGLNANGTTLTRSTCDGAWQLIQTFTRNIVNHELTITMTLKNTSGGQNYTDVELARYFDGDIDSSTGGDRYNRTFDSVHAQESTFDNLMLTALTFNTAHLTAVHTFSSWNRAVTTQASAATPTAAGDFVGRITYQLGTVNNNTQRIVKVLYKRS